MPTSPHHIHPHAPCRARPSTTSGSSTLSIGVDRAGLNVWEDRVDGRANQMLAALIEARDEPGSGPIADEWEQDASRFNRRHAASIPVFETGRCADADRGRAEAQREHERQERRRKAAEELGDPRR